MVESVATRRLCLMADVGRDNQHDNRSLAGLQRRLMDVLDKSLKSADVVVNRTLRQDRSDGQLIALPIGVNETTVVPLLIHGLLTNLDNDRKRSPQIPLRLRVSMVRGTVTRAGTGYVGRAVIAAARLLESTVVQDELRAHPAALFALIASDDIYQDVLAQGYGGLPATGYRRASIELPDKEWRGEAWIRAWESGPLKPPAKGIAKAVRDSLAPVAGALPGTLNEVLSPETSTGDETHGTTESHDTGIDFVDYMSEDHVYTSYDDGYGYSYAEEYVEHGEYASTDYDSADSSAAESPGELY